MIENDAYGPTTATAIAAPPVSASSDPAEEIECALPTDIYTPAAPSADMAPAPRLLKMSPSFAPPAGGFEIFQDRTVPNAACMPPAYFRNMMRTERAEDRILRPGMVA